MIKKQFKYLEEFVSKIINNELKFSEENIGIKSIFTNSNPIKSIVLSKLIKDLNRRTLVFTKDFNSQQTLINDLEFFSDKIETFGLFDIIQFSKELYEDSEPLGFILQKVENFKTSQNSIIFAPTNIIDLDFPSINDLEQSYIKLRKGQELNYEEFVKDLLIKGYQKTDYVSIEGEIAIRGGIIDIFPIGATNPFRIEIWGNEIESIREFDSVSQRSIKNIEEFSFLSNIFDPLQTKIKRTSKFKDFFETNTIIVIDEIYNEEREKILSEFSNFLIIEINPLERADCQIFVDKQINFKSSLSELTETLVQFAQNRTQTIICSDNKNYLDRLRNLLFRYLDENNFDNNLLNYIDTIQWLDKPLSSGFVTRDLKFAILTEHQIFDRIPKIRSKSKTSKTSLTLKELENLQVGDYVVHEDKGIGQFDGFQTIKIGDSLHDCIRIKYQDDDILYLQLAHLHKIDKYSSAEGVTPKLSKLGSPEWERRKAKLKKKIKDISRELIKLYAQRKNSEGFAFPADTIWQKEFEASFMFEDTIDQAKASEEVKSDMESPSPMDRLVCGDVGFGKTEVAIRAAFKAATNGKQVALLVPTTILAQQHYMTFKDRMERYPINIALLSRFKTKSELKESLEKIEKGEIDIVIGTHRLLSEDVKFKDLGLLIIDEEHRFGVAAKEKLRHLKINIDTLTMTATPIPRTLNFSLLGVRDISVIETPPPNRLPVYTEVIKWDKSTFRKAALRELSRNGQIFFVSDKIYDLDKIAIEINNIVPEAKITIAHGQMKPKELESIMEKFLAREFNILVTTKIIESGLDIPNANTIFINRAQNFGLAELYQLRGRVGRSNIQAYCYLIIPSEDKISEKSIRRLQALEEFTDLGSGLKLAMRDMEIRGAGNLLGAEQSGFIDDLGYELYSKILEEAVREIKEEEYPELLTSKLDVSKKVLGSEELEIEYSKDSYINKEYVASETERFILYRRMFNLDSFENVKDFENELIDRFGKLPEETKNLLFILRVRLLANNTGFRKIKIKDNELIIELPLDNQEYYQLIFPALLDYLATTPYKFEVVQTKSKVLLKIEITGNNNIIEFLWKLKKNIQILIDEMG